MLRVRTGELWGDLARHKHSEHSKAKVKIQETGDFQCLDPQLNFWLMGGGAHQVH